MRCLRLHTAAAMIIRGFRWGRFKLVQVGILYIYIGGLHSTYVSSGALLSPVSHTRRFLDQFLWSGGWRLDTKSSGRTVGNEKMTSALRNPCASARLLLQGRTIVLFFGGPISPTRAHDSGSLAYPPFLGLEPRVLCSSFR